MNPSTPSLSKLTDARLFRAIRLVFRHHVLGSLFIVLLATQVISAQVQNRVDFASTELAEDVEDRWGAPVVQPAPSLRYVQSGTVFTELRPLPFDKQHIQVDARMNYRKRGLRYFSGFDFTLSAQYAVENREGHDIDVAFVFPVEMDKTQVLLSELTFLVNGKEERMDLGESGNRLVWTGRIARGQQADFAIRYRARGLDSFTYKLDPSLPARDVRLHVGVEGGDNFDYPAGVLSANEVVQSQGAVALDWAFASLESGVNLGVILPSEKSYDTLIATMARRAWVPFLGLMTLLALIAIRHYRRLAVYEAYLIAASYGFTFVLLAYLAAFMNFYLAYAIAVLGMGAVFVLYARWMFPSERLVRLATVWAAALVVPTAAVILQGYTGLIYTLELLGALLGAMALSTRDGVRAFLSDLPSVPVAQEVR